jgi:hypothetical protein
MDNSPAHSRYSELSLSQQSYHVSLEPTIHHQELVDSTSEDEDEERESSMDGDTQHDDDANVSEFVGGIACQSHSTPTAKRTESEVAQGQSHYYQRWEYYSAY